MLYAKLQELLGVVPIQFEPLAYFIGGLFLLFLVIYFAEFLKLLVFRK